MRELLLACHFSFNLSKIHDIQVIGFIISAMVLIGFHSSVAGGVENAVVRANKLEVNTFQIFLNAPRVWAYPKLAIENVKKFKEYCKQYNFENKVTHLAYLPNPSSSEKVLQKKSYESMKEAVIRCDILGMNGLVIHIGSHKGKGIEVGMKNVINTLDKILELEPKVKLLLETSSGSPKLVGNKFEEIGHIIDNSSDPSKLGVCFDTCHVFAAGYDIANKTEDVIENFDEFIGLNKMKVIHANGSKGELGSKKDRHEHIGLGFIGEEGFRYLLNHKIIKKLPFIIETPNNDTRKDIDNLNVLRRLAGN